MVFTKLCLENALAIRPCNCEAALEPLLPKVARCIPVLSSCYVGKCAAHVLKRSGRSHSAVAAARVLKCSALLLKVSRYLILGDVFLKEIKQNLRPINFQFADSDLRCVFLLKLVLLAYRPFGLLKAEKNS